MSHNTQQQDIAQNAEYELRSQDMECVNDSAKPEPWWYNLTYAAVGLFFGITFVKAEIISWYRMQEMFRFQSFHMYGVIGTAVVVGAISVLLIKRFKIKTIHGEYVVFHDKTFNKGQVIGGLIFGLGWGITGACPGPLFAQLGAGFSVIFVGILFAVAGTWVYGLLRERLPH